LKTFPVQSLAVRF